MIADAAYTAGDAVASHPHRLPAYLPELRRMIRDGVGYRKASKQLKISRGAAFESIKRHGLHEPHRCPGCGRVVTAMPCLACKLEGEDG